MLTHFESYEQQERADLEYGRQLEACQKLADDVPVFRDHSIQGDWSPDED